VAFERLNDLRVRLLPMFEYVVTEYGYRTPPGYPLIVDTTEQGSIGLEIDPAYAIYFMEDGDGLAVEFYTRNPRNDARTSASRMRHGGAPDVDHRHLSEPITDQDLRDLIAELKAEFNQQPSLIHMSDT
jgi:hypothetical protein